MDDDEQMNASDSGDERTNMSNIQSLDSRHFKHREQDSIEAQRQHAISKTNLF